mgnify:CR=1 FL=1
MKDLIEIDDTGICIVEFGAPWCGPCRLLMPVLESIEKDNPEVNIYKVNVDDNPELATRYSISGIPTIIFFKDGVAQETIVGLISETKIQGYIDEL